MLLSNCDKKKLTFTNFLLTGDKFMPKVSLILYGDPMNFMKEKILD